MKTLLKLIRWPFEILSLLRSIDRRLENIEKASKEISTCVDNNNHRQRRSIRTAHWND
jgi:hypothetical protein